MDNVFTLLFVVLAGVAVFAGLHKEDIQAGRIPAPLAAYING